MKILKTLLNVESVKITVLCKETVILIPVVFHNLKKYDSLLVMQELVKLNLKTNVIPKRLEKYMSFNINSKLGFIDNFQFLRSSLDILVKT